MKVLNKENFEKEVLKSEVPVLVDFSATWCGPCRAMEPVLKEVAGEMAGKAVVGKIDIDENAEIANRFGIRSVPSMLIFSNGEVADRIVGITPKRTILEKLGNV
ncbi:MAG: thioredoxin [Candidatus Omnitrophica bacterium]|nr:thioredoxin [Candidatus Omnitrophota bacterium]